MFVAGLYQVPCFFVFGRKRVEFAASEDIELVLEQYRANLLADGYSRTTVEVLHIESTDPNRIRCLVTYKNYDEKGIMMNSEEVSCFLEGTGIIDWRLTKVEYINDPLEPLFADVEGIKSSTAKSFGGS